MARSGAPAAWCRGWRRWSPAPTPSGSPPPSPTATVRPPTAGRRRGRGLPGPPPRRRPRHLPRRLRRGLQRHALVPPPRPVRPGPAPPLRPPLPRGVGRLPARSTGPSPTPWSTTRARGRRRCSCRTTTSPWSARSSPSAAPTCASSTSATPRSPTPTRWRVLPADLRPRAAGGHGRPPRLRLPLPALGRRLRRLLRRAARPVAPPTFVAPLAPDADDIGAGGRRRRVRRAPSTSSTRPVGDRALIVRVDRIELSKNILRGFLAFEDLLERYPEWRERVVFGAFVYPSREGLPEYLGLPPGGRGRRCAGSTSGGRRRAGRRSSSTPPTTSPARSPPCAGPTCFLVNPIRDGLNLVAKEGPLVNERDAVLLLSPRGRGVGRARRRGRDRCTPTTSAAPPTRSPRPWPPPRGAGHRGGRGAPPGGGPHPGGLVGRPAGRRRLRFSSAPPRPPTVVLVEIAGHIRRQTSTRTSR